METALTPGSVIKGKYRVEHVLGAGGMGTVVAAVHLDLREHVALKFLLPEFAQNSEIVERFLREARAALKIKGEHVARVMDIDRLDDGTPFLVMEFLAGHDLSSVRSSGRPLPLAEAVTYVAQAAEAIAEAHKLGIVHRDLKPANLFLTRRSDGFPCVKVLDFGISKVGIEGEVGVTKTSTVMGTAEYMSPEQMRSARDVDGRADIWALGVILYELTTARMPFPGETITEVCARVFTEVPSPPSSLRSEVPPALEAVILRCLERDRGRRYQTANELIADLRALAMNAAAVGHLAPARHASLAAAAPGRTVLAAPAVEALAFGGPATDATPASSRSASMAPASSARGSTEISYSVSAGAPSGAALSPGRPGSTEIASAPPRVTTAPPRGRAVAAASAVVVVALGVAGYGVVRTRSASPAAAAPVQERAAVSAESASPPPVASVAEIDLDAPQAPGPASTATRRTPKSAVDADRPTAATSARPSSTASAAASSAAAAGPSLAASAASAAPTATADATTVAATASAAAEPDGPAFDRKAAAAAIQTAAVGLGLSCSTSGTIAATITFAPSGAVSKVLLSDIFLGPAVRLCVSGYLRSARVPPFVGAPVTVTKTIQMRQ